MTKRSYRILTNQRWIAEHAAHDTPILAESLAVATPFLVLRFIRFALGHYDAVFIDGDTRKLLILCAAKKLFRPRNSPILSSDLILSRPADSTRGFKFRIRKWLLEEIDSFVFYFRDTRELQELFSIPPGKVRYVPFKANALDDIRGLHASEEQYFLSPGRSNRDLETLFAAFESLPYSCRVLANWREVEQHGTTMGDFNRPGNIELLSDDGSSKSWNALIASALAVVVPIQPGKLSPSGIGTYLVAMAAGKCVIMTEGPATRQILTDDTAVLVPARDVHSLRKAIIRVAEDSTFRKRIALNGQKYALSLGGDDRLRGDLARELARLLPVSRSTR